MLEKNKDYVEFTLQYTSVDWARSKDCPEVCLKGYSDFSFPGVPIMDVVCNEFDHKVVVVSKRDFEKMQADNQHYREMAKQWEENHNLLLQKTGFDTVESLVFYLTNFGCDTLLEALASYVSERDKADENYNFLLKKTGFDTVEELVNYLNSEAECDTLRDAIANLEYNVKFARDERRNLSKKLDECEKDYISERDKAEALQTENEQLKKKLSEFDFMGWMESAKLWKGRYNDLSKLVGFSSEQEIEDYLVNEAECDTLHEAISKLHDQVKYTCEEWYSANNNNNSWKVAAECNSPKELIEKREALEKEIEIYSRALKEWKEGTCCPSPSAAKTLIESGMSYEYAYHESQKENRKLTEEVDSWKNVTGYSTPEDYMHARINCATPFDYTAAWKTATGCDTPDKAKSHIEGLENAIRLTNKNMLKELDSEIDKWQKATGCDTPGAAEKILEHYKSRLGNAVQAASCAAKHLDNITF